MKKQLIVLVLLLGVYGSTTAQVAIAAEPTMPAANLEFTDITASSAKIQWEPGDGEGRIVTFWEYGRFITQPRDGEIRKLNAYSANGVVYHGQGNYVRVQKLKPGTTYYAAVYEFNGSGSQVNYLTVPEVIGCFATAKAN